MAREKKAKGGRGSGLVVGRLSMTRRGYGFVEAPEGDIYISARDLGGAMHGDTVGAKPDPRRRGQGRSGRIVRIVDRANRSVVGHYERHGGVGIVVPADRRIRADIFVSTREHEARNGDVVVASITRYPTPHHAAQGYIEEIVGRPDDPGIGIEIAIREHGLRTVFPEDVLAEAEGVDIGVEATLGKGREDMRERFTFTVDPADARDFDDAISIERVDGRIRLSVHIADVSHYVAWDSAIDAEARLRATSVYLVDRVLPMLPERLSNGVCSLNPDEDRLAFTVELMLTKDGVVEEYRLLPSAIRSDRRFNYDQVLEWLEGRTAFPDAESEQALHDFARITDAIERRRVARGGLEFETVEAKVVLDPEGKPLEVRLREKTKATSMIEEAMILANEVVARHMAGAKAPMVYRIHEDPDPDSLEQIAVILKEFDYPIKEVRGATPATFQKIIAFAAGRPERLLINSLLLRAMERARYVDYLAPHFGLASGAYTHFTSPIRRYPDLMVHRLLKAQLTGTLETDPNASGMTPELGWLADHSSFMEREAEAAEDETVKMKIVELMAEKIGEVFTGIVTGVQSFGLFVQLPNTAEGLVHVESMTDDYFRLDAERFMLVGEASGRHYRLGQSVRVRVLNVSVAESRIDLEFA